MTVESPTGKASANWDVYGTPDKPVAKNVILLIADGLSMGHRTSARLMSKGVTNGMYNGKLSMDTLPTPPCSAHAAWIPSPPTPPTPPPPT